MHQYLKDTEYATQNLLRLATEEEQQLRELSGQLASAEARLRVHQWDFQTSDLNDDFSDAYVMAAFGRAAKASQDAERLRSEVAMLQASVGAHQQATQAVAGAVLQIAKQGISLVHGGLNAAPTGRTIGSLCIRDIIWQGRNQSMHYEEGNFKKALTDLFATLESEQGTHFSLAAHPQQNRAKQIVELLGWEDYATYARDMQTLLP
ncbi:hypothetical protein [Roseateles sp. BYS87W]|uniref:Uncharacterized protein n=1 Tax=Pelomonas baiyunensis TaxID=3299026 RepID=A0ABW7H2I5_9BURK